MVLYLKYCNLIAYVYCIHLGTSQEKCVTYGWTYISVLPIMHFEWNNTNGNVYDRSHINNVVLSGSVFKIDPKMIIVFSCFLRRHTSLRRKALYSRCIMGKY